MNAAHLYEQIDATDLPNLKRSFDFMKSEKFWSLMDIENRIAEQFGEMNEIAKEMPFMTDLIHDERINPKVGLRVKMFYILWSTTIDLQYQLINEAFDLGLKPHVTNFKTVVENRNVASSRIPSIVRQFSGKIRFDEYTRIRNRIVHEGAISDIEFNEISTELNATTNRHFSLISETELTDEEYKDKIMNLIMQLGLFSFKKSIEFEEQLKNCIEFHNVLAKEIQLAVLTRIGVNLEAGPG